MALLGISNFVRSLQGLVLGKEFGVMKILSAAVFLFIRKVIRFKDASPRGDWSKAGNRAKRDNSWKNSSFDFNINLF